MVPTPRQLSNHAINLGVLALALLPLVFFSAQPWANALENRHSAPLPDWPQSAKAWRRFPAAFDAFFNDSFGLRQPMIALRNEINDRVLGKSPITIAMRGRKYWLFYTGDSSIADYMGRPTLSADDLKSWAGTLRTRHDLLAARGIPYYFVVAPDKQSIYPEFMQPSIYHGQLHELDRLLDLLHKSGDTPWVIDLRPALLAAKGPQPVYFLLDVHWNDYGAFVGYETMAGALRRDNIAARKITIPRTQFTIPNSYRGGDLADMMGLRDTLKSVRDVRYTGPKLPCGLAANAPVLPGLRFQPFLADDIEITCPQAGNATFALIFHDSMLDMQYPYLFASFGHSRYVRSYPATDDMLRYVNATHPSIVIEERVERLLSVLPPAAMPVPDGASHNG